MVIVLLGPTRVTYRGKVKYETIVSLLNRYNLKHSNKMMNSLGVNVCIFSWTKGLWSMSQIK